MIALTGEMLGCARMACGMTQRDLAHRSGISIACIRDFEQERVRHLRDRTARQLVMSLGVYAGFSLPSEKFYTYLTNGLLVSILGPVTVARNGRQLQLGSAKQRRLLGLLTLYRGLPVGHDTLVDILWAGQPPRTADGLVQTYVSRLRHILWPSDGKSTVESILAVDDGGYKLQLNADQLDSACFDHLIAISRLCAQANFDAAAFNFYEKALSLWYGEPLADVEPLYEHPLTIHLRRKWADAVTEYAAVGLAKGWYSYAIPHLYELIRKEPVDEEAVALLIKALAGCGRQAAALKVFDDTRRYLDEELGVLPGHALNEAHIAVLRQTIPPPRRRQSEETLKAAAMERGVL